jgi:hypothetical protein
LFQVRCVDGGAIDEVVDEARLSGRRYRRCNWTRFLNDASDSTASNANVRCFREEGQIVFEAVEVIADGSELVVTYSSRVRSTEAADNFALIKAVSSLVSGKQGSISSKRKQSP